MTYNIQTLNTLINDCIAKTDAVTTAKDSNNSTSDTLCYYLARAVIVERKTFDELKEDCGKGKNRTRYDAVKKRISEVEYVINFFRGGGKVNNPKDDDRFYTIVDGNVSKHTSLEWGIVKDCIVNRDTYSKAPTFSAMEKAGKAAQKDYKEVIANTVAKEDTAIAAYLRSTDAPAKWQGADMIDVRRNATPAELMEIVRTGTECLAREHEAKERDAKAKTMQDFWGNVSVAISNAADSGDADTLRSLSDMLQAAMGRVAAGERKAG